MRARRVAHRPLVRVVHRVAPPVGGRRAASARVLPLGLGRDSIAVAGPDDPVIGQIDVAGAEHGGGALGRVRVIGGRATLHLGERVAPPQDVVPLDVHDGVLPVGCGGVVAGGARGVEDVAVLHRPGRHLRPAVVGRLENGDRERGQRDEVGRHLVGVLRGDGAHGEGRCRQADQCHADGVREGAGGRRVVQGRGRRGFHAGRPVRHPVLRCVRRCVGRCVGRSPRPCVASHVGAGVVSSLGPGAITGRPSTSA